MSLNKLLIYSVISLLVFSFACSQPEQDTSTFSISGRIKNPQNGKIILSQIEDVNRKKIRVIGEFPIDEAGKFSQSFDLQPHIYELDFYGKEKLVLAINKGQTISITADGNDLKNVMVEGSVDTDKLLAYESFRKESLNRLVISVRNQIKQLQDQNVGENKQKIDQLGIAEIDNYEKHRDELNDFIKKNMSNSISIYPTTLRWDGDKNIEFYESLAGSFEKENPELDVTKRINEKVQILKNTSIGGTSAEIKMPDTKGVEVALSDKKGKYILIDFWASWCGPCRRESQKLTEIYSKYKSKGFEIYGVSLDSDKNAWLNAIDKDKRIWTNVSTLQGYETPVSFEYAVTALPAKFIIDSDGKIIAKNLHGDKLKEKIESLFAE